MNTDTTTATRNEPLDRCELVARWYVQDGRLVRCWQRVNPAQAELALAG
jgi:hypothetical protein